MESPTTEMNRLMHDGQYPDGYRVLVVSVATGLEIKDTSRIQRSLVKYRAVRTDGKWEGPWRSDSSKSGYLGGAEGHVIGDAWKHVTNSKGSRVDEAGEP